VTALYWLTKRRTCIWVKVFRGQYVLGVTASAGNRPISHSTACSYLGCNGNWQA